MRLFFLPWMLLLCGLAARAQQLQPLKVSLPYSYFTRTIPVEGLGGKMFRVTAALKKVKGTDSSYAAMGLAVLKGNGQIGFQEDAKKHRVTQNKWEVVLAGGRLDTTAKLLYVVLHAYYDGTFGFDALRLEVEDAAGKWKSITLDNAGFERNNLENWVQGTPDNPVDVDGYQYKVLTTAPYEGKYSLEIQGTYTPYGRNPAVGGYETVNGIKMYYESYGEGQPLILMHGNGGSIRSSANRIAYFRSKYRVIAIDSRAHGNSGDDGRELTYDLMADDVNQLLEKLHVDSAFMWGQSDGGILAVLLAMRYPNKVKRAAGFGINIQADTNAIKSSIFLDVVDKSQHAANPREKQLNTLLARYPNLPFDSLRKISAPFLVMSGDRDVIRLEHSVKIFQHMSNAQLFIMPGASHFGSYEKPRLFNEVLSEFFEKPFKKPGI